MVFYPNFFDFFQVFLDKIIFDYLYVDPSNVKLIMEETKNIDDEDCEELSICSL